MKTTIISNSVITILLLIFFNISYGQITEKRFFSDTTTGKIKSIYQVKKVKDGILIAANSVISTYQKPLILKLNKKGEVVWSTLSSTTYSAESVVKIQFNNFEDDYIYCIVRTYSSSLNSYKIWKINSQNGNIVWTKPYIQPLNYTTFNITDYDSLRFILVNGNTQEGTKVMMMSKITGDTIYTKNFNFTNLTSNHNLEIDQNKNIYLSVGKLLTKFNKADLNLILWQKDYSNGTNHLDDIQKLLIDQYDDIYLIGNNGGSNNYGSGIVAKINPSTGNEIWKTLGAGGDLFVSSVVDNNNKIYISYRHALVGGGTYFFNTCKINKANGIVDWNSNKNVTPLGSATPNSGSSEAVISIDVDCNGDVYQTGYYGDANYGPGSWGIMKLSTNDGSKLYDLTITEDSAYYDRYSAGLSVCTFGNTPFIIGQVETLDGLDNKPLLIKLNSSTGSIIKRKYIESNIQYPSKTIDIINHNDTIFLFKQIGKTTNISKNYNNNIIWEKSISNADYLRGGNIKISDSLLFVTACNLRTDSAYTYTSNVCNKLMMYKFNIKNGLLINSKTISFSNNIVEPMGLEADKDTAYIFYQKDNQIFYHKWDSLALSPAKLLGNSTYLNNFKGEKNTVYNFNDSSLLALNSSNIYKIKKSTLSNNILFNNPLQVDYYNISIDSNNIYLSGNTNLKQQTIVAVNKQNFNVIWNKIYEPNGCFFKLDFDSNNNIYALGVKDSSIVINKISKIDGNSHWCFHFDSLSVLNHIPLDIKVHKQFNYLTFTGARLNIDGSSDAIISLLNFQADSLFTYIGEDELIAESQANTIEIYKDSSIMVGGTLNTDNYSKSGFVFVINKPQTIITTSVFENKKIKNLNVYPNPTNGIINIEGLTDKNVISFYDYTGKKYFQISNYKSKILNIGQFKKGIYLLRLTSENEQKTFKIIKY